MDKDKLEAVKETVMEVAKLMYEKNLVNALEGNVSCRIGDKICITPSGMCKGYLKREMIVVIDISGNISEGIYKPSSEYKMHLAAYNLRDDIKAVVHTHSPYATAYAIANKPIMTKAYPEAVIAFDYIPLVEYGTPSTDAVYSGFSKYIYSVDVFLIANHGIVSVGQDPFDAFFKIEAAESIAKVLTIAGQIGGEHDLPEDEIDLLYEMRKKNFGRERIKA